MKKHQIMRTTLTLQDDAFAVATAYASARALKFGEAVSELIRLGKAHLQPNAAPPPTLGIKEVDGRWIFNEPPDAPVFTAAQVRAMLDEAS